MGVELRDDALLGAAAAADADPGDMLRAVATAGAQVRRAASASAEAGLAALAGEGRPRSVVVLAAGSAAVAGEALAALAGPGCPVPVVTVRGYELPAWVGAADVVVALTASGHAEETVSALDAVARRGCRLVAVAPERSAVAERVRQARGLVVPLPETQAARVAFWGLLTPLVVVASHLDLLPAAEPPLPEVLEATASRLESVAERCRPGSDAPVNPAKVLAAELAGSLPLVWGAGPLAGAAASRFAGQLAENAKTPALPGLLPAAVHDQLLLLDGPYGALAGGRDDDFFRDRVDDPEPPLRLRLLLLRDGVAVHPRTAARSDAVREVAQTRGVAVSEVMAEGQSGYERLAELVGLTDYASVYVALLLGVDPTGADAAAELARGAAR